MDTETLETLSAPEFVVEPKEVISPEAPVEVQPKAEKKKLFRFIKREAAAQVVTLVRSGKQIEFRLKKVDRHGFSAVSTFETDDEELASDIRETAENPMWAIVEK